MWLPARTATTLNNEPRRTHNRHFLSIVAAGVDRGAGFVAEGVDLGSLRMLQTHFPKMTQMKHGSANKAELLRSDLCPKPNA
jgi:hypothetical protein